MEMAYNSFTGKSVETQEEKVANLELQLCESWTLNSGLQISNPVALTSLRCSANDWGRDDFELNHTSEIRAISLLLSHPFRQKQNLWVTFDSLSCCFHLWKGSLLTSHPGEDGPQGTLLPGDGGLVGLGAHLLPSWINRSRNVYFQKYRPAFTQLNILLVKPKNDHIRPPPATILFRSAPNTNQFTPEVIL